MATKFWTKFAITRLV